MIKEIQSKFDIEKLEYVHHISDIHIRNYKRHEEYNRVFSTLYEKLRASIGNSKNSLICLTGDIVHSKTDVSPELFHMVQEFLNKLCEIGPVLLIPGNHDANLNNMHRMDSLTPIVNAINNDNLEYLKESSIINIGGVNFYHWSVFDSIQNYPKLKKKDDALNICLFHGAVNDSTTEVGFVLKNDNISVSTFKDFDLVFLGDIHKTQYLNEAKTIAYPGSLIQQNHGEDITHGYLLWNINSKTSEFVSIENDTAFFTLDVNSGVWNSIPDNTPKNLYLRIRYKNTEQSFIRTIVDEVRKRRTIVELSTQRINDFNSKEKSVSSVRGIDFRSQSQQKDLLKTYLVQKYQSSEEELSKIYEINDQVNKVLSKSEVPRNSMWIPKRFEFENMFSYGKNNVIDFTSMKGTCGLFAPNASGKSTLLDSLTYCIFDKCTKTTRGHQVMNSSSDKFYCKLNFELNGLDYYIIRDAKRQKSGNVRVEVDFYYIDEDGFKISLNGKDRTDTNNNIKALLGNYEDFVLTTLSTQSNNTGFIDMNQKDRKDLLSQFMDIGVFEEMYNIANTVAKDTSAVLRHYQKTDYEADLSKYKNELLEVSASLKESVILKNDYVKQKSELDTKIIELVTGLQNVDSSIIDQSVLDQNIERANLFLEKSKIDKKDLEDKINTLQSSIDAIQSTVDQVDEKDLEERDKHCVSLKDKLHQINIEYETLKSHMSHKRDKMDKLKELEYDPNCKYCMNNIFVKDAIQTKTEIETDENLLKSINVKKSAIEFELAGCEDSEYEKLAYTNAQKNLSKLQNQLSSTKSELEQLKSKELKAQVVLKESKDKLLLREKQLSTIENNDLINFEVEKIKADLKDVEIKIKYANSSVMDLEVKIKLLEKSIQDTTEIILKRNDLERDFKFYEKYLEATHRDGIPHDIISLTIPQIEEEVNNILSQLVDFRIIFETDDKNINAYIAYTEEKFWPLELTSGMEKFVSSLAIRSALINISTLPRPNFIAIDEGFGSLDKSNLSSMSMLFDYLKTQFRFLIIISHIDSMRDVVDFYVDVNKIDGRSSVKYQ